MTNDLKRRLFQHKSRFYPKSFSARYALYEIIYYAEFESTHAASIYEQNLKKKKRSFKLKLIREINPDLLDLSHEVNETF